MSVTIHGFEVSESEAISKVLERIKDRYNSENDVDIFCAKRIEAGDSFHSEGWLEYTVVFRRYGNREFVMGMIQRKPNEEYEFHS